MVTINQQSHANIISSATLTLCFCRVAFEPIHQNRTSPIKIDDLVMDETTGQQNPNPQIKIPNLMVMQSPTLKTDLIKAKLTQFNFSSFFAAAVVVVVVSIDSLA